MEKLVYYYKLIPLNAKLAFLALFAIYNAYTSWDDYVNVSFEKYEKAKVDVGKFDEEILRLGSIIKSGVTIKNELQKTKEEIIAVFENLPAEFDIEQVLSAFATHAKSTSVEIKKFVPAKEEEVNQPVAQANPTAAPAAGATPNAASTPKPDPKAGPATASNDKSSDYARRKKIEVELVGQYKDILNFLDHVLGMPRVILLDTLKLGKTGGNAGGGESNAQASPRLSASMSFLTFSQKQEVFDQLLKEDGPSSNPSATPPKPPVNSAQILNNSFPTALSFIPNHPNLEPAKLSKIYEAAHLLLNAIGTTQNPLFMGSQESKEFTPEEIETLKSWLRGSSKTSDSNTEDKNSNRNLEEQGVVLGD